MIRIALKGLLARKLRLLTTSLAVLLGVAFMSGTFVLTDTLAQTFDRVFADATAGTDAVVRGAAGVTGDFTTERARIPARVVDAVRAVPGVAAAEGMVEGYTQIVGRDGDPVGNPGWGPPTFGRNWVTARELSSFELAEGRAPNAAGEVVLDRYTAKEAGVGVGDTATVLVESGPRGVRVVGVATFAGADGTGGPTHVMFTTAEAQRLLGSPGRVDAVAAVAADGVSQRELRDRLAAAVPGVEVITGAEYTEENQSVARRALGFFNAFLFTFAVVALLVGAFLIHNTFSIIVAQRGRENALLRALGASRRQVLGSVIVEAFAIGLVAAVTGMLAGVAVAAGLKAVLAAFGIDLPADGLVFAPRTAVVSLVVGVGVSVVSALLPARRAAKVPPVAAMRELATEHPGGSRRRTVTGLVITALGAALLLVGLLGDGGAAVVGLGATVVFFGVAALGPVLARPASRLIGAPLPRLRGVPGTLARENAMRNPKRTAATAAALMIGVGLVGFITVFAESAKTSIDDSIDRSFTGDFVVDSGTTGFGGLSPQLADRLRTLPELRAVARYRMGQVAVGGESEYVGAVDPREFAQVVDLGVTGGSLADLRGDAFAVDAATARRNGWRVGDVVPVTYAEGGERPSRVVAIYDRAEAGGQYLLPLETFARHFPEQFDTRVFVSRAPDVPAAAARAAVERVAAAYPNAKLQDQTEFKEAAAAPIDQLLGLIYVLLFLAILIAFLGIMNTLALSILERTRELGLLRAVGMSRAQLRSAVRWEAVIIALFGTALGLVVGLFFGWALVQALADLGIRRLTIPVGQLATIAVVGAVAGVAAAALPGRRAARLDVLRAVTTE